LQTSLVLLAEVVHIKARTIPDGPGQPEKYLGRGEDVRFIAEERVAVADQEEQEMTRQE
jgi:hypothetical protein